MTKPEILRRYFKWCSEKIEEQVDAGFRDIRWIGGDFVEFVLSWIEPMSPSEKRDFLLALLVRRWVGAYGDAVPRDLARHSQAVDWESFMNAGKVRLLDQPMVADAFGVSKTRTRAARSVAKEILRTEKARGHAVDQPAKNRWTVDSPVGVSGTLRLHLDSGSEGFRYWQDLTLAETREAFLRESYLSWFGFSHDTVFENFDGKNVHQVAEFVIEAKEEFAEFVGSWLF